MSPLYHSAVKKLPAILFNALAILAMSAVPALAELGPAPDRSFSIVVIPDTQHYRGKDTKAEPESTDGVTNAVFQAYTEWIARNLDRQRIAFVSHVGDIVDKDTPAQWAVARAHMDRLHGRTPYGISVGNHDMKSDGNSTLFQEYFPASRYKDMPWYGGCYVPPEGGTSISGNNANSYQLFSVEGIDFLFLHLECNAPDEVLAWADQVLGAHPSRRAMVTTHMYLGPLNKPKEGRGYFDDPKGRMQWTKRHGDRGNSPQQMWDKGFRKHKNLWMVFCGDQSRTQSMYSASQGDSGNQVHELLSDYGNNGLRIYRFFPGAGRVEVVTHNPIKNALCDSTRIVPNEGRHQFVIHTEF